MVNGLKECFNNDSEILILGSLPSVISIKKQEYYANPTNQFWKILSSVFEEKIVEFESYQDKLKFLKKHKIALWDVIKNADRDGSLDVNIRNEEYNDLYEKIKKYNIRKVYVNGKKAEKSVVRYLRDNKIDNIFYEVLTSSSSANTRYTLDNKILFWKRIILKK